jgi:hypothetical protein
LRSAGSTGGICKFVFVKMAQSKEPILSSGPNVIENHEGAFRFTQSTALDTKALR